ncbi:MAG: hypothetical protein N2V72_00655 [Methanophagales archaeon]|nr:hypothetical protein [Methanophagales archaeon]
MVNISSLVEAFGSDSKKDGKYERRRKIKAILITVLFVMSTASFQDFVLEEAVQMYNFGIMSIVMNKDWDMLREELPKYQAFHDTCLKLHYVCTVLNPFTGIFFQNFYEADQYKIDVWTRLVNRHDSRFRIVVAGEVVDAHVNGDGTGVIIVDTGSVREYIVVPFPEVTPMPKKGELVQLECAEKYIRGTKRLELVEFAA